MNIVVGLSLEMKQKRWTQQSILRIDPHLIPSPHLKCFLSRTAFVIYSFLFILKDSSLIKSPRLNLSLRQRAVPLSTMLGRGCELADNDLREISELEFEHIYVQLQDLR